MPVELLSSRAAKCCSVHHSSSSSRAEPAECCCPLSEMLLLVYVVRAPCKCRQAGTKAGSLGRSDGPPTAKDPTTRQKVVWSPALGWGPTWDNLRVGVPPKQATPFGNLCFSNKARSHLKLICLKGIFDTEKSKQNQQYPQPTFQLKIISTGFWSFGLLNIRLFVYNTVPLSLIYFTILLG